MYELKYIDPSFDKTGYTVDGDNTVHFSLGSFCSEQIKYHSGNGSFGVSQTRLDH